MNGQLASFCRLPKPEMSVGFVSQKTSIREVAANRAPRSWVRFAKTQAGSQSGFVLSNSADRELASFSRIPHPAPNWVRFVKCSFRLRAGFVLQNTALGAPPWLRFPNYLFSNRSTNRCARTRVFRFLLITTVHSNVKARNASKPASTHKSPARDDMAKDWQARPLPASRANAYR